MMARFVVDGRRTYHKCVDISRIMDAVVTRMPKICARR